MGIKGMEQIDVVGVDHTVLILNDEEKKIFELIDYMAICGLVSLFGMVSNIINIIIFYKQGFENTANLAFLGLAISDLLCLMALFTASISVNPLLPVYDTAWVSVEVMYLSSAWPHVCFCRITSCITVYITAERFLSIALPLKVKQIVTLRRTAMIIFLIFIINILTLIPEYITSSLDWRFVPRKNRTLMGITFTSSRKDVEGLCHVIHALLSATSFFGVIVFTFALVFKLRKSSEWRKEVTSKRVQQEAFSQKERKTVKMVVLIACVLIICYIPGAIIAMATFVIGSEFNVMGKYLNICEAVWSIACACQSVNSSINIFFYYRMSSKYRHTFGDVFARVHQCKGKK